MGVFSDLKPTNHAPRNGFDCSRRSVFSLKNGMILPVFVQPTLPNSDYRIDVQQLLRTQPLQTAAFTGFSINYDFAFVPYNQLYSSFNQFIGQREDAYLANQPTYTSFPLLPVFKLLNYYRRYICYDILVSGLGSKGYDEWTRYFSNPARQKHFVLPFRFIKSNYADSSVLVDFIRSLDMYGYGNLLPIFKQAVNEFYSKHALVSNWQQLYELVDSDFNGDVVELLDEFDVSFEGSNTVSGLTFSSDTINSEFNYFAALAYNKIFYEFYRNKYYDTKVIIFEWSPEDSDYYRNEFSYNILFNVDDNPVLDVASLPSLHRFLAIFSLHYHAYRRDLFTGVLPSMQFGNVSMQIANAVEDGLQTKYILEAGLADRASVRDSVRINAQGQLVAPSAAATVTAGEERVNFGFAPELAISVLESRRADAMQRFRERMLRAGDSTRDIFKAHGWESPRFEQFHEPIFLGSFDGRLDINTVAATTNQGPGQELGQLAANGVGVVSGSEIKFHSGDFGVIIGVMYIVKDSEYNAFGTDRQFCLTEPFDFPYPELQNISLSPVVYRQLHGFGFNRLNNTGGLPYVGVPHKSPNDILGYLPAFMEYKTAVDKVHGEFCAGEFGLEEHRNPRSSQAGDFLNISSQTLMFSGVFSDWVTPRRDILQPDSLKFLYQQPSVVDNVFVQAQTDNQDTDPFLVNAYFKCLAVQPLSVIGLPV